jgi:hypothetical protein
MFLRNRPNRPKGRPLQISVLLLAVLAVGAAVLHFPVWAHDLPLHTVISAFVTIEQNAEGATRAGSPYHLHLVVRVPLDLLRTAQFPLNGNAYDLAAADAASALALQSVADGIVLEENGTRLEPDSAIGRLAPSADRSFEDYHLAVAHVAEPIDAQTKVYFEQGYFDAHLIYPIATPELPFTIRAALAPEAGDLLKMTVRFQPLRGESRAFLVAGQSGAVPLNPSWFEATRGFVVLGVGHILSGIDHLLFLLCLIIPFRQIRGLIPVITAFTLGHSVTLIGSAFNLAPSGPWFPPFVETAIAASILYMALENIVGANLQRRWIIAGLFGLVHGFGFSYALKDQLQFAGSHLLLSLFSFNVGIELGQLAVLCVVVPVLGLLFRGALAGRTGIIVLSAIVAHTAWHWMIDRGTVLWNTPWPQVTGAGLMVLARWVAAILIAMGLASLLGRWIEGRRRAATGATMEAPASLPSDT